MLCVVSVIAHSVYYDCQLRLRFEQFYIVRFHITFAPWWMCNILMTNYGSEMYDIPTSNKQIHIPKIWAIRMFTINLNLFEGIKIVLHATDCMLQMVVHLPVATATSDNAQKKKKEKRMKQRVEQNIYTCFCFGGLCVCFFFNHVCFFSVVHGGFSLCIIDVDVTGYGLCWWNLFPIHCVFLFYK